MEILVIYCRTIFKEKIMTSFVQTFQQKIHPQQTQLSQKHTQPNLQNHNQLQPLHQLPNKKKHKKCDENTRCYLH